MWCRASYGENPERVYESVMLLLNTDAWGVPEALSFTALLTRHDSRSEKDSLYLFDWARKDMHNTQIITDGLIFSM